jgi:hypothetical protein
MKPRGILKWKVINGKKIPYALAMMYEQSGAKKFKKDMVKLLKEEIKKQNFKFKSKPSFIYVSWIFIFQKLNMDSNNYYKCFIDSITALNTEVNKIIWDDDNISMMKDERIYYDSSNPRCIVKIYPAPYIGIFDDKNDYNKFINTYCSKCKKGDKIGQKGGCTIYRSALESRIQDNLHIDFNTGEKECLKFKDK